jgi:hypothetical protein
MVNLTMQGIFLFGCLVVHGLDHRRKFHATEHRQIIRAVQITSHTIAKGQLFLCNAQ